MLNSKLEKFLALRAGILLVILAVPTAIFMHNKYEVLAGLVCGTAVSILRFNFLSASITKAIGTHSDGLLAALPALSGYIIVVAIVIAALVTALKSSIWLFIGLITGIFIVPLVIIFYGIAGALGITHNRFE